MCTVLLHVDHCTGVYTIVRVCTPLYGCVHYCSGVYTVVRVCTLLFGGVHRCTGVYMRGLLLFCRSIFPRLDARNRIVGRQREKLASRSDLHDDTVRRWVTHDDGVTLRGGEVSPRRGEVTPRGGDLRARLGKRRDERAWD